LVYALKEKMFEIVWKLTKPGLRTDDFYSVFVAVNIIENPFRTRPDPHGASTCEEEQAVAQKCTPFRIQRGLFISGYLIIFLLFVF
jgi:hypothetical protein